MSELVFMYNLVREAGQFAPLVVIAILWIIRKNELRHLTADIKWLKTEFIKHLEAHAKGEF